MTNLGLSPWQKYEQLRENQHPASLILFNVDRWSHLRCSTFSQVRISTAQLSGAAYYIEILEDALNYGVDHIIIPRHVLVVSGNLSQHLNLVAKKAKFTTA